MSTHKEYVKDYPWLCSTCQATMGYILHLLPELEDTYASDEEGAAMYMYDKSLYCGGTECLGKEKDDERE